MNKINSIKANFKSLFLFFIASHVYAQECNENIVETTPTSRFTQNSEFITDNTTQLFWMRCALGQVWKGDGPIPECTGTVTLYNWKQALDESIVFNAGNGWRLPNIKELSSIVERACVDPAINETVFPSTDNEYWTSSPVVAGSGASAWAIGFNGGGDGQIGKSQLKAVRLVRNL